jgi:hypothetical protein
MSQVTIPSDRQRRLVELKLSGFSGPEIAELLRYSSGGVVRKTLCRPHVKAYANRLREQIENRFLEAQTTTLADLVEASARRRRAERVA